jgi:hypothetical protein
MFEVGIAGVVGFDETAAAELAATAMLIVVIW